MEFQGLHAERRHLWHVAQGLTGSMLQKTANAVYSPACIHEALRVIQLGATDKTKKELDKLLGRIEQGKAIAEDYGFGVSGWGVSDDYKAASYASLWLDNGASPSKDFLENYPASELMLKTVDFSNPSVSQEISSWIKKGTEGLLSPQLNLSPLTLACIVSVLYFKDAWTDAFDPSYTKPMTFHSSNGDVKTPFMSMLSDAIAEQRRSFLTFSLHFTSGAKMVFALPNEGIVLSDILRDPELYDAFANPPGYDRRYSRTELFIPKFECESIFKEVAEALCEIGFSTAGAPEIKPITGTENTPASIVHGAKIIVDESGVEAAAYTIDVACLGLPDRNPPKPIRVVLDRPFAYAIVSSTGLPLFIGTVNDPTLQ